MKSDGSKRILRTAKKDGKRWEWGDKERERERERERETNGKCVWKGAVGKGD